MKTAIHATSDFVDDVVFCGKLFTPAQLDGMVAYLQRLGTTRLDWHYDTWHDLYERMPFHGRRNLLAYVVEKAHAAGMEVHAVFKPFEMGGLYHTHFMVPHPFPRPVGIPVVANHIGISYMVDPFVLEHPDMRLKRMAGDWNPPGRVTEIKLVKADDAPAEIKREYLSVWTSRRNGEAFLYEKPWNMHDGIEERGGKPRRVLTLRGLDIDEKQRYIIVKCSRRTPHGSFSNALHDFMEIYAGGRRLPSVAFDEHVGLRKLERSRLNQGRPLYPGAGIISPYARHPAVLEFVKDTQRISDIYEQYYRLDVLTPREWHELSADIRDDFTPFLDRDHGVMSGFAGLYRGKAEYCSSLLHPVYPEVRNYWLDVTRRCLACGVDGVSYRVGNHNRSSEPELYGFNDPVLKATGGSTDAAAVSKTNGDVYTQFLREARDLLHAAGKVITIQVATDTHQKYSYTPWNFEWQWERWIEEDIADVVYAYPRAADWTEDDLAGRIAEKARRHGKPVIFKCGVSPDAVEQALRSAQKYPGIAAINLYETAFFTHISQDGVLEGSPELVKLIKNYTR